jgi:hypothetical protein
LGDPGLGLEDFKADVKGMGFGVVEWIHLAQDRIQWRALVYVLYLWFV